MQQPIFLQYIFAYWLRTNDKVDLKSYTYPLIVFSLQALKISFSKDDIERSINEMFLKLDNAAC